MDAGPLMVSTDVQLHLLVPGAALPVPAALRYDASDPYAVRVDFRTGDEPVTWTFARQLLSEGVDGMVGEGDVRVWPSRNDDSAVVCIALSSPSGRALFEGPLHEIVQFLALTYEAVPTGTESDHLDLDAELALLLWTA